MTQLNLPTESLTPFSQKLTAPLTKQAITVLQINLGRRCNLACSHCHVEASPQRTEELSPEVCDQLLTLIRRFPQIQTVDLTGGAPEMNYGFRPLVETARAHGKAVIVRSNLTICLEPGYEDLPAYFAQHQVRVVASLPCYSAENVDRMRGQGVFERSIEVLRRLNQAGYGRDLRLALDLVYNPQVPQTEKFALTPDQAKLEKDYKASLDAQFGVAFDRLLTITNLPIGRTKFHLQHRQLYGPYLRFLETHFNPGTVAGLMCLQELSVDYLGQIYDCDFNQMEGIPARTPDGQPLTVAALLAAGSLDLIERVQTADYCYGCTAGAGSSCGGSLV